MESISCSSTIFIPPLWKQRRRFILDTLKYHKIQKVIDYGCGEGSVMSYLIPTSVTDDINFTHLIGLDLDKTLLIEQTIPHCEPWPVDYHQLRETPLTIDIYHGSVDRMDYRIKKLNCEALVCTEVIEHLYPHTLHQMIPIVFDYYSPSLVILTTPNGEYNHFFPQLRYGTKEASFRHDDHKFEWTRYEFESWCKNIGQQYGYRIEFHGIGLIEGKKDQLQYGYCTQACIFTKKKEESDTQNKIIEEKEEKSHTLLKHIEFPCYQPNPLLKDDEILQQVETYLSDLCQIKTLHQLEQRQQHQHQHNDVLLSLPSSSTTSISSTTSSAISSASSTYQDNNQHYAYTISMIDKQFDDMMKHINESNQWHYDPTSSFLLLDNIEDQQQQIKKQKQKEKSQWTFIPMSISIESIWSILTVRQLCKTKRRLVEILNLKEKDYQVTGSDIVVHKSFKIIP
ncbi:hypothetical protein BJ944DRAFT_272546 [Cunninghamella echinulata]|nr:hypothetical protein BJ944DRAFT_272546 [Cunninghamella echinulata]